MKRIEIIANKSVQDELVSSLEREIGDFEYTLIPTVFGKGRRKRKLGTRTWPELNFLLVSYLDDASCESARNVAAELGHAHPEEGVACFMTEALD